MFTNLIYKKFTNRFCLRVVRGQALVLSFTSQKLSKLIIIEAFVVSAICAIMDEINTEHNMKSINMLAGGGSVDRAPDSQRTNASSKLERRKYSFITHSTCE